MSSLEMTSMTISNAGKNTELETTLRFTDEGPAEVVSIRVQVPMNKDRTLRELQVDATKRAIKLLEMTLPE